MHKGFLKTAFILAALTVAMGAFAAHGLKNYVSDKALATFETAVRYQFYHVFALMIAGILYKDFYFAAIKVAGWLFITGIILFSGSLYLLCYVKHQQIAVTWVGAITPLGGVCFIAGWVLLAVGVSRRSTTG